MIITTIRPSDFTYNPGVGLVQGYYRYLRVIDGQYTLDINYNEGAIGTTAGYINKILEDKSVSFRFIPYEGANKIPILYKIYGGSINGLGTNVIPEISEDTSFNISGDYIPEVIVQNISTGEEITSLYTVKLNAAGNYLTMFTDWDGDNNSLSSNNIFILCIGNKDVVDTSGIWLQVDYQVGQNLIKQDADGSLIFHYYFESLSNNNIVENIIQHIFQYENTDGYYKLLHYDSNNYLTDRDNSISVYLNTNRRAIGSRPFYIEVYEDEINKTIEELNINTIEDGVYEAPEGTVYNKVNLTIPKQEYVLDLTKNGIVPGSDAISTSGIITPIIPDAYLINKISGKVLISDLTIDIESNGTEIYRSHGFYNDITVNTNVMDTYLFPKIELSIGDIYCDENTIRFDESYIEACIYYSNIGNNLFYLSIDGTNYNQYTSGDDFEIPINLGKFLKRIYYKIKNVDTNNFGPICGIDLPIDTIIINAISVPKFNITKISDTRIGIALENIDFIDYNFECNITINDENYTINDIDNTQIIIDIKEPYINVDSYFSKTTNNIVQEGKHSQFIVDVNAVSTIEIVDIEYRDTAYVYSKVPTKYYGVYLTLLKLLSDNGETLLNDCASACKSSSHKLTSLWNMFNAACGAYLNDNKKLADVLIKTITSQLNIMYDENFDFLQHRIFIGNYTLGNKNNPNEFNTVDLYKLTPTEYDVCSDVELTFTIKQTSDIHYIMLPPELDLKYVSFGDTIKTVLFDSANNINLYKTRSWRMADKDTDGTIYWYYSPAGAFSDMITVVCKHK
jgi:hypothetical protein